MKSLGRWLLWLILAGLALQLFFLARIALMVAVDPSSTAFMRSEAWRVASASMAGDKNWRWSHQWVDGDQISPHLKRAVIASEDAGFNDHGGVDWSAIEGAWQKNERRQQQAEKRAASQPDRPAREPKIVGGSTITQQLAKNLLLSPTKTFLRKGEEAIITVWIELLWDKRRILEVYLNVVEWGDGVFGAEAAARRYFNVSAAQLNAEQAARLAVMLPAPRRYERNPYSAYMNGRTQLILGRMGGAEVP